MSPFQLNKLYTGLQIHERVGGRLVHYLPSVAGRVVAGCFRRDTNPEAPSVILPGHGRITEASADRFTKQRSSVPAFLKERSNAWRYAGTYSVERHKEVSSVLFLKRIDD